MYILDGLDYFNLFSAYLIDLNNQIFNSKRKNLFEFLYFYKFCINYVREWKILFKKINIFGLSPYFFDHSFETFNLSSFEQSENAKIYLVKVNIYGLLESYVSGNVSSSYYKCINDRLLSTVKCEMPFWHVNEFLLPTTLFRGINPIFMW